MTALFDREASNSAVDILPALNAVDRLNSWARSTSILTCGYHNPKRHIYHLKRQAIEQADLRGLATHLPIQTQAQCNRCGGTGIWQTTRACRYCTRGTATLRFWQTTIAGVGVWHSPSDRFPYAIAERVRGKLAAPGEDSAERYFPRWERVSDVWYAADWTVNQPGRDLTPVEACEALNTADIAFLARDRPCYTSRDWGDWIEDPHYFQMYLGEQQEPCCAMCRASLDPVAAKRATLHHGPVKWTGLLCRFCETLPENHYKVTPPEELTDHIEVRRYIARMAPLYEARAAEHARIYRNAW